MNETTAAWIRENVLVFRTNPARPKATRAARAGGPCACNRAWTCDACQHRAHDQCQRTQTGREHGLYGPGLTWAPRASVWLADRTCTTRCACTACATTPVSEQLAEQLDLFEAA